MRVNQEDLNIDKVKSTKVCVCYGFTADMEFAAGVSILNFVDLHGSEGFDFILYSDSRLPKLKAALGARGINVEVNVFHPPIRWLDLYSSRAVAYFSPLVLSKFEVFSHLSHYRRVIWFDYDIVIKGRLTDVISKNNFDLAFMTSGQPFENAFISPPQNVDVETLAKEGLSAGLLVVNDTFPDHQSASPCLYSTYLLHSSNLYYPEQAILDIFLNSVSYKWLELDGEIYCADPKMELPQSLILHSWGPLKFWDGRPNQKWTGYYQLWLGLGGGKYSRAKSRMNGISRKLKYLVASRIVAAFGKGKSKPW